MRTRKLLVPLIVCYLCMGQLVDCQDEEPPGKPDRAKFFTKYREKNSKKKNHPNIVGRAGEEDSGDDEHGSTHRAEENSSLYRNNRAMDLSGSSEGKPVKSDERSAWTDVAKKSFRPSEFGRSKYKKTKNVTIGDGICQSVDIRNSVDNFEMLKSCHVIEGYLQIVLIQNNNEEDFQNVTFPLLREITGYFLAYRVKKLKTFNNMFPNLEVIRGDVLLADYSFMIYEMQHLQEIGLNKLTEISRGAVRIEKNPSLCYTSTLDWSAIVVAGENFIKDNSNESTCPVCTDCAGGHCWNANHCQKIEKLKCHEQCLGECSGPTEVDCYVCKNYRHQGRCVESCPPHLYAYLSRRCITKEECLATKNTRKSYRFEEDKKWRPFNGSCHTQCPNGYEDAIDEKNSTTCRLCQGRCQKIGASRVIRHISDAQVFRGTTIVDGSLEFQIRNAHPNILEELTEAFGMVEEITHYLRITHSFPITTLSFFKNLHTIKGEMLDMNNASLVVLDNPNLSSLFADDQKIEIQNGRLFFHYNPKLCMSKIRDLGAMSGITNITDLEVQPDSNGDKVACDIVNININVRDKGANNANIVWDAYAPKAGQTLLSYLLNYIEAETGNVSYETNACGNNTWQIIDVEIPPFSGPGSTVWQRLIDLKPYTKYAAYVKTFAARDKNSGNSITGQSEIMYFRTETDIPSVPTNVAAFSSSDSEITVKWEPPEHPNGPINHYIIAGYVRPERDELLSSRNYCDHGLVRDAETDDDNDVSTTTDISPTTTAIVGSDKKSSKFSIFCFDIPTMGSSSSVRKNYCYSNRYNVDEPEFYGLMDYLSSQRRTNNDYSTNDESYEFIDDATATTSNDRYSFFFNATSNSSSYVLKNLRHYSLYTISVAACGRELKNGTQLCSSVEYAHSRTKKRSQADDVRDVNVHVSNDTIVIVTWPIPSDPNGLTLAFTIEYTNLNVTDAKKSTECVAASTNRQKRAVHYIKNLSDGTYSVRVRSLSLAGEGNFSETVYFSIEPKTDNAVVASILLTVAFLIVAISIVYLAYRYRQRKLIQERLIASVNPDYMETTYVRDEWEVSRKNIEILEELGVGNFGLVYRGILDGSVQVAVKTIAGNGGEREKNEFLNEASVMKTFSTSHIIRLLGVVSEGNPPYVIMELMENGDLKSYLRRVRDDNNRLELSRLIRMACEIADGMAYLESRKFVHRDLAARNCMVSIDLVCKIGDFGMARDIYETDYYKVGRKGLLPIRWMAPENLSDGVFTSDSDVWSYGVVLFELVSFGELPYQGMANEEVIGFVLRRGKLLIPPDCPEVILKIIEQCLKWRPSQRPTFMAVIAELEPFIGQDFCEKSYYHSEEGVEIRRLGLEKVYHHAAAAKYNWENRDAARWAREFEDNVTLLDQTKAGASTGRLFSNGFQHFGNLAATEDVPIDR